MIPEGLGSGLRIPPHSEEAERGVLGSILLDPASAIDKCLAKRLDSESFYDRRHQALFEQMVDMSQANVAMDAITIAEWLKTHNALEKVGGYDYLVQLQDSTLVPAHVEFYCDIVQEKNLYRCLIDHSNNITDSAYKGEEDASLLVSQAEASLFELGSHGGDKIPDWKESVKHVFTEINKDPNDIDHGVTTGYKGLNERLRGLAKTDMIVLAARPAMGKTSLAMNIAENAALGRLAKDNKGVPVGIFSLEMSREQLVRRMLFSHARVSMQAVQKNLTTENHMRLTEAVDRLSKANIYIDDTPGLEAVELRSRARRMKSRYDVELIIIDYLQLMNYSKFSKDGRQRETMAISGAIKAMAKELDIPVVVLSQLSRATEGRGDNIPKLSDLRDSGAIEQDADVVLLLYRPSYYKHGEDRDSDNRAIVDVAKFRHGETGDVQMSFIREYTRFEDRDPRDDDHVPANY
ncbi:MAG: replicative DNA helicase [Gammaproteobacteria bacterium]|nr:MAG: replicative DNA helicase [Gammaproteobacteria bacterium]